MSPSVRWPVPAVFPDLGVGAGHVWAVPINVQKRLRDRYLELLSADEHDRWQGYQIHERRNAFAVCRGVLRTLLGAYLRVDPAELRFCYGARGKPHLRDATGRDLLQFNLSHSGALALIAVSWNCRLGVDLERLRADFPMARVSKRIFSLAENAILQQLPLNRRIAAFFECWTRREAYLKAIGQGFAVPPGLVDVPIMPTDGAVFIAPRHGSKQLRRWRLHALSPARGYVAALVAERRISNYDGWHWRDGVCGLDSDRSGCDLSIARPFGFDRGS